MKKLIIMLTIMSLIVSCAAAQKVTLTDGALEVHPIAEVNEEETKEEGEEGGAEESAAGSAKLEIKEFHVLGYEGENLLVYADNTLYRVPESEMGSFIGELDTLPDTSTMGVISKGDKGEAARVFQQYLTDLDYLSGIPDGSYGNGTATAVKAFQKDVGLEQTGQGDIVTQLMLISMLAEPLETSSDPDPKARFAAIEGEVDADLTSLYELNCKVSYDDIIGTGFITVARFAFDNNETRDLDRAEYELRFGFAIDGNTRTLTPRIIADCTCLKRPMMRTLYIKTGDTRLNLEAKEITSALSGVKSVETATFEPDGDLTEVLEDTQEGTRIRIAGDYAEYDITLTTDEAEQLCAFAKAANSL